MDVTALLNWDLFVDKNSLSVSPTDKALPKYVQTVDRQGLTGQHVSCLQTGFTGVSTEPSVGEGLVPPSQGQSTSGYHGIIPTTW